MFSHVPIIGSPIPITDHRSPTFNSPIPNRITDTDHRSNRSPITDSQLADSRSGVGGRGVAVKPDSAVERKAHCLSSAEFALPSLFLLLPPYAPLAHFKFYALILEDSLLSARIVHVIRYILAGFPLWLLSSLSAFAYVKFCAPICEDH